MRPRSPAGGVDLLYPVVWLVPTFGIYLQSYHLEARYKPVDGKYSGQTDDTTGWDRWNQSTDPSWAGGGKPRGSPICRQDHRRPAAVEAGVVTRMGRADPATGEGADRSTTEDSARLPSAANARIPAITPAEISAIAAQMYIPTTGTPPLTCCCRIVTDYWGVWSWLTL
jgi:hypothetical protein